ncbi:hypothetical protein GCM10020216_030610 [Nonomuraea helvata]
MLCEPPVWDQVPAFYFGNAGAVVGPYDPVLIPPGSAWLDYELEVAAIVGMGGTGLSPNAPDGTLPATPSSATGQHATCRSANPRC